MKKFTKENCFLLMFHAAKLFIKKNTIILTNDPCNDE